MAYKYSFEKFDKETMARACGTNLKISLKKSVEVSRAIRGKKLDYAISYLEKVMEEKQVVPYVRYIQEMPHKKGSGVMTGGYPTKVAEGFLKVLRSVKSNAKEQELDENLVIKAVSVRKGSARYHYGRYSGRKMKSTNLEIVVEVKQK